MVRVALFLTYSVVFKLIEFLAELPMTS